MKRRKTNTQVVIDLMDFSSYGALAQIFVMDALLKQANAVATATDADLASMENGFISPIAWRGVAQEIMKKIDAHLQTN